MWKYMKKYLPFGLLGSLFMFIEVLMDLLQPELMSRIVDEGVLGLNNNGIGDMTLIWTLGIRMVIVVVIGILGGALTSIFVNYMAQNVGNLIRKDCFRKMLSFSFSQVDQFGTGSLITRVTNDVTHVQQFSAMLFRSVVRMVVMTTGSVWFMFRLNSRFGLIVLCACPVILGCILLCLKKGGPMFAKLQTQLDAINAILQEDVSGIRIIKACVRETYEKIRFGKANDALIKTQLQVLVIFAFMNPIINAVMYLVIGLLLLAGSVQVTVGGTTPGDIMAAITYTTRMLNGILMVVMISQNISRGTASWIRLKELLDIKLDLTDGEYIEKESFVKESNGDQYAENDLASKEKQQNIIVFENVSFAYPGSRQIVLKNINLTIRRGETIAIMGTTGCGKTTLASLIPRFYDPSSGIVRVDGVDVREYKQIQLRDKISFVLQKTELFGGSVRENIAWGNPNASLEEIEKAAIIAQADEFIRDMPSGYETQVAERGVSLSGGQKQRLSIARAVLKSAEIMIFDDATSALDLKTEARLFDALADRTADCTKIIVAQRIASVRRADRIVVLDKGNIASVGNHEELMASCEIYQDIYHSQMGKEALLHG